MFLVVGDAYSEWIEVFKITSATAAVTIHKLREYFSSHGLPDIVVSENGTAFTGEDFALLISCQKMESSTSLQPQNTLHLMVLLNVTDAPLRKQ